MFPYPWPHCLPPRIAFPSLPRLILLGATQGEPCLLWVSPLPQPHHTALPLSPLPWQDLEAKLSPYSADTAEWMGGKRKLGAERPLVAVSESSPP